MVIGRGTDSNIFIWSFGWWPHALLHGENPVFTHAIWAPDGVNLSWVTSVPGLALLFAPLTLVAGIGHWALGAIDWPLMGVLLIGSLPGIVIGSYCAVRVPEKVLRVALASVLILVAGKLASGELNLSPESMMAFARSAAH